MVYWYLVSLVFSGWDGSIVSQKRMARFETLQECQAVAETLRNADVQCLPDAIEFDRKDAK